MSDMVDHEKHITRLATAYHEAGHACVELYHGFAIRLVSIRAEADSVGRVTGPGIMMYEGNARQQKTWARQTILGLYAGVEAQRLVDPNPADYHGSEDDDDAFELSREFEVFPRHIDCVGDELHMAYLEKLRRKAARLVHRLQPAIVALAGALLERETLTGDETTAIVQPWIQTKGSERRGSR